MNGPQGTESSTAWCGSDLHAQMLDRYGPLISGRDLRRVLGFQTAAGLRQAALRGVLPIPVFTLPNRKGRFAMTSEVSAWIQAQRDAATLSSEPNRLPRVARVTATRKAQREQ